MTTPDERAVVDDVLFPDLQPVPLPAHRDHTLSAGQRLTARQHHDVQHGRHPLHQHGAVYDPALTFAGHQCGDCWWRDPGTYPKCMLTTPPDDRGRTYLPRVTQGPATDCRAWWPACRDWKAKP